MVQRWQSRPFDKTQRSIASRNKLQDSKTDSPFEMSQTDLKGPQSNCSKENMVEQIKQAKNIVETQFIYLKATGFINYLNSINKKLSAVDRSLVKYQFQFTRVNEKDLDLFGGIQGVADYITRQGKWGELFQEQNYISLNCKNNNFVSKINKYFKLLKKMDLQFFEQYHLFLTSPLQCCLNKLGGYIESRLKMLLEPRGCSDGGDYTGRLGSSDLSQIILRMINYHSRYHKNCNHISEFLQKIGYYRYAL